MFRHIMAHNLFILLVLFLTINATLYAHYSPTIHVWNCCYKLCYQQGSKASSPNVRSGVRFPFWICCTKFSMKKNPEEQWYPNGVNTTNWQTRFKCLNWKYIRWRSAEWHMLPHVCHPSGHFGRTTNFFPFNWRLSHFYKSWNSKNV